MQHENPLLKVAIVHDWLPVIGGAEKVLQELTKVYPQADIYTLFNFLSEADQKTFGTCRIYQSYLAKLPRIEKYYRKLLPLFPQAIESFDLSAYDLVISSSSSVAKGVLTGAHQKHIAYVHSPARYAWDLTHQYLKRDKLDKGFKGWLAQYFLKRFRIWDYRTANGVDQFIANSAFVKKRIWKTYRRSAEVIYPPIDTEKFTPVLEKSDYYFTASRQVPYKRIDLIVEAFTKLPQHKLVVIGTGPDSEKIKKIAQGHTNITILGFQDDTALHHHMSKAKAFIFAAEEDFGIIPVEAQACGTPVIAYGVGGAVETVVDFEKDTVNGTGLFFKEQNAQSIIEAVQRFENNQENISKEACVANAKRFSTEIFKEKIRIFASETLTDI